MLTTIRIVLTSVFCYLSIQPAIALDFSGSTVISSDVNDGLNAIGGVEGDTLLIEPGITVTQLFGRGVELNSFPFKVTNNGKIESGFGIISGVKANIINNGVIIGQNAGSAISIYSGKVINNGFISDKITIHDARGVVTNNDTISGITSSIFLAKGGEITNNGNIFAEHVSNLAVLEGGTITNSGTLYGKNGSGIYLNGEGEITNAGIISGEENAFVNVKLSGDGLITNSGRISGKNNSIQLLGEGIITNNGPIASEERTDISVSRQGKITNNSTISGGFIKMELSSDGNITNSASGTISSGFGSDIFISGSGKGLLTNNGLITSEQSTSNIILFNGGRLINTGSIINGNGSSDNGHLSILDGGEIFNSGDLINQFITIHDSGKITNTGNISCDKVNCDHTAPIKIYDGGTVINSGTIIGNQYVIELSGESTVINSGVITSNNGIAISTGNGDDTVTLQSGSIVEGIINGGFNTDNAVLQGHGTYNDDFQEFENLTMEGTNWNLTGNSSFNDTQIKSGLLSISGTHTSPITIQANGSLGGSGTIIGNVSNNGSVAPGNSIGTTTINGDYVHQSNANLIIEFDNENSDQLIVTGHTTLNGGTLTLVPLELVRTPQAFTFLQSETITGQFDTVLKPAIFKSAIFQDGNKLNFIEKNIYQSLANTSNQVAIASSLQDSLLTASGDLKTIMLELDSILIKDQFTSALDQLSPEPLAAFPMGTFTGSQLYAGTIAKHLRELQKRPSKTKASHYSLGASSDSTLTYDNSETFSSAGWQSYIQPYGVFSSLESDQEFTGFNANTGGIAIGIDRRVNDSLIIGANIGWSFTDIDWDRSGTEAEIQAGRVAGYMGFQKDNWELNGIVSYGYNYYEAERKVSFGSINRVAESEHDGHEFSFYLNSAYSFQHQNWQYGPVASIQYIGLFEDDYNESGAGSAGFNFDNNSTHSLRSTLGIQASVKLEWADGKAITPELEIGWAHEILDNEYALNAQFQNATGRYFNVRGRDLDNASAYVGAGITASLNKNTTLKLNYNADIGRNDYINHMANFMLIVQF